MSRNLTNAHPIPAERGEAVSELGHKIRESADSLCRGKRYEAADAHVKAGEDVERILGITVPPDRWNDFLSGWDAAMEVSCKELADENVDLHGIIIQLCERLHVKRCEQCNGSGFECSRCDRGFVETETEVKP